jgi:hypothetical protein
MTERILTAAGIILLVAAGFLIHVSVGLGVLGGFLVLVGLFFDFGGSE